MDKYPSHKSCQLIGERLSNACASTIDKNTGDIVLQKTLAKKTGMLDRTIRRILNGETATTSYGQVKRILACLKKISKEPSQLRDIEYYAEPAKKEKADILRQGITKLAYHLIRSRFESTELYPIVDAQIDIAVDTIMIQGSDLLTGDTKRARSEAIQYGLDYLGRTKEELVDLLRMWASTHPHSVWFDPGKQLLTMIVPLSSDCYSKLRLGELSTHDIVSSEQPNRSPFLWYMFLAGDTRHAGTKAQKMIAEMTMKQLGFLSTSIDEEGIHILANVLEESISRRTKAYGFKDLGVQMTCLGNFGLAELIYEPGQRGMTTQERVLYRLLREHQIEVKKLR